MSNRFLNDHSVRKVVLNKILKITVGGFHYWCDSNVGIIRKPSYAVPEFIRDTFLGTKPEKEPQTIIKKEMIYKLKREKLKWYRRLWNWIVKFFSKRSVKK